MPSEHLTITWLYHTTCQNSNRFQWHFFHRLQMNPVLPHFQQKWEMLVAQVSQFNFKQDSLNLKGKKLYICVYIFKKLSQKYWMQQADFRRFIVWGDITYITRMETLGWNFPENSPSHKISGTLDSLHSSKSCEDNLSHCTWVLLGWVGNQGPDP